MCQLPRIGHILLIVLPSAPKKNKSVAVLQMPFFNSSAQPKNKKTHTHIFKLCSSSLAHLFAPHPFPPFVFTKVSCSCPCTVASWITRCCQGKWVSSISSTGHWLQNLGFPTHHVVSPYKAHLPNPPMFLEESIPPKKPICRIEKSCRMQILMGW